MQSGQAGGAAVLDLQFEAAGVADALDRRRGKHHRPALLNGGKAALHFGHDGKAILLGIFDPLLKVGQDKKGGDGVAAVGPVKDGKARELERMADARHTRGQPDHLPAQFVRALQGRAVG